jgi:juvenile hormone epoxide hydrolase
LLSINIALSNNPIGLAAWILEKFSTATNREYRQRADGGFENDFTLDALLDNIMIYYLTNSATTSSRIYKENFNKTYPMDRVAVEVPTGCAHFKNEIQHQFNFLTQERFKKIIHNSYFDHGGHFAAMQLPKILHKDFVLFVKKTLEL